MTYTNNEFANIGSTNLDDLLEQINTYKWKLKHKASKNYYDCFNPALYEEDEILEQKTTKCCKTVELFSANSTSDKDHGKQITHDPIKLLNTYFSDIFGHNNTKIVFNTHKYLKIIIPDAIYEDFLAMISQYNLQPIQDFLLETIAIAQQIYTSQIDLWSETEKQKLINTASNESQKVIEIIEQSNVDPYDREKPNLKPIPKLSHINFVFNPGSTIKISHGSLKREFVSLMMNHYNNLKYKGWRKELKHYKTTFADTLLKNNFKYQLTGAYYHLLSQENFFDISIYETPNALIECITKLLEFSLITISNDNTASSSGKIKDVRQYIIRHLPNLPHEKVNIHPKIESLNKYFPQDFLSLCPHEVDNEIMLKTDFICERFNLKRLKDNLAHIINCINTIANNTSHQITFKKVSSSFPELENFSALIQAINENEKITDLKYTIKDKEYQLTQKLPLHLIEKAIREYINNNPTDMESDLISEEPSNSNENTPSFKLPHQRYMAKITKGLFHYLEHHSEINSTAFNYGDEYYNIIAVIFMNTGVLRCDYSNEITAMNQVKQWHNES